MFKSRQLICLIMAAVVLGGCEWKSELYEQYVDKNGYIATCHGVCTGLDGLNEQSACESKGGAWIPGVCYEIKSVLGEDNSKDKSERIKVVRNKDNCKKLETDVNKFEWEEGICTISDSKKCNDVGGKWENYDYEMLDLGNGEYIRRIKEENGEERYICGAYAVVYRNDINATGCKSADELTFKEALKYKLCTVNTTCQVAYPVRSDFEDDVESDTSGNDKIAICSSCPLNNILCRNADRTFTCKKIDSDPQNCGGCGIECDEGMSCIQGKCEEKHLFMCKDEGNITCGIGADGVPNCYDPKSMKTCGVVCENNTAQFTSCVQNEVCIENNSLYSCQCLLMKDKSQSGLVCGTGEDRRCIQPDAEATCGATCDSEGKKCPNHTECKLVEGSYQCVCTDESLSIETQDGNITCINPQKDMTYCGLTKEDILAGKTHQCLFGEECKEGECVCKEGYVKCGDACIDPSKDALHCGASGDCSQTASGENYRGEACGDAGVCENGVCHCNTENGYVLCDGECIDPTRNADYCGASGGCENGNRGTKCENATPVCIDSICKSNCPQGQDLCGSTCVDLKKDLKNCGVCGQSCQFENANAACWNGVCGIEVCKSGYGNCDNKDENGCEIDLMNDVRHCGACGNACELPVGANGVSCEEGKCKIEWCDDDSLKCGDTCIDVSADINNCGACGNVCTIECYDYENQQSDCQTKCEISGCCVIGKVKLNNEGEGVICCKGYDLYRYILGGANNVCDTWDDPQTYHYACFKPDEKVADKNSDCYIKI